jgi:hypothetical protein
MLSPVDVAVQMHSSLTADGVTWYFDRAYEIGQYVTGDYYVVGPVKLVGISPRSEESAGRTINGSMVNPNISALSGFDSWKQNYYRPELNVARTASDRAPLELRPGTSLLSSISNATVSEGKPVKRVVILTVVSKPPPTNSFRPPYVNVDKAAYQYTFDQVHTGRLLNLPVVGESRPPSWEQVEQYVRRPFIDFAPNWDRRHAEPTDNNTTYGRDVTARFDMVTLMLSSNYRLDQKKQTLIGFIQAGIDLYGIFQLALSSGVEPWRLDGAHSNGRKWPIMFAGAMLGDEAMVNMMQQIPSGKRYIWFHDDAAYFYVSTNNVSATNSAKWRPSYKERGAEPYSDAMIGMPEYRGTTNDAQGNAFWSANPYRRAGNTNVVHGQALVAELMGLRKAWDHEAFFDYVARYVAIMGGEADPFGVGRYVSVDGAQSAGGFEGWQQYWNSKWRLETWRHYHPLIAELRRDGYPMAPAGIRLVPPS